MARYGGEEFCIVLPSDDAKSAKFAAERMRIAIADGRFVFEGRELRVTASVGVAVLTDGDEPATLIKRADGALYASKRSGRNCGHFHNGTTCERIVVELSKEGVREIDETCPEEMAMEARKVHERRAAQRRPFERPTIDRPYSGGAVPNASLFYEVACHDISATGFPLSRSRP